MLNVTPSTIPQSFESVCLYILMRTDLDSLNPGKACAQASHAANQCVYDIRHSGDAFLNAQLVAWEGDRGFGTCIVLASDDQDMLKRVVKMNAFGIHCGVAHDPSYPLLDGKVLHLIPLNTCAYAFGLKEILEPFVSDLSLMD